MSIAKMLAAKNTDELRIEQGIADMEFRAHRRQDKMCIGNKAVVCLRFDDGRVEDYTKVFPALRDNLLVGSFAVVPTVLDLPTYMTTAQVNDMVSHGMEIMSHSKTHGTAPANKTEEDAEIKESKALLEEKGWRVEGFTQPGTWTGAKNIIDPIQWETQRHARLIRSQYLFAGTYSFPDSLKKPPFPTRYGLNARTIDADTEAATKKLIDTAVRRKESLSLLLHPFQLDQVGRMTSAEFTAICNYLKEKRDAGLLEVISMGGYVMATQQYGIWENMVRDSDFESLSVGNWGAWYTTTSAILGTDGGKTGSNYVSTNSTNALGQTVSSLDKTDWPGTTVLFRGWSKMMGANGPRLKVTINDTQLFVTSFPIESGVYKLSERPFTIPIDATSLNIVLDSYGAGYVHWDDIQILRL